MKKLFVLCQIALAVMLVGCKTGRPQVVTYPPSIIQKMETPTVVHREKALLPGKYTLGVVPSQTETATNGIVWERHLKELQLMQFEHERELVAMEYEAKKREYAKEKGLPLEPPPAPVVQHQPKPNKQKAPRPVVIKQIVVQEVPPQNSGTFQNNQNQNQNGVWYGGFYP